MPLPLMRCLVLALAATALVAGCGGRVVGSPSPLMMAGGSSEGGYPIAGSGPSGTAIRFIEHGRFAVGIILRNKTGTTVTVVDVRTPEPPLSLVEQVGTRLEPWKPPACPKNTLGCPPGVTFLRMSFGDVRPSPMSVGPGKWLAVQLNYQLASCHVVPLATTASARELQVTFRYSQGRLQHQELPIGAAKLRLSTPAGVECLPRPHSHIGLVGSFTTSPGHGTIPGSDGDTCTRTSSGGLAFRSRQFFDRSGIAWRIRIRLPRVPASSPVDVVRADVRATGGFGLHGWTTFNGAGSRVTLQHATRGTLAGSFTAIFSDRRRLFRAYGEWRCTMLPRHRA